MIKSFFLFYERVTALSLGGVESIKAPIQRELPPKGPPPLPPHRSTAPSPPPWFLAKIEPKICICSMSFLMWFWVGLLVVFGSVLASFWCHFGSFLAYVWVFLFGLRKRWLPRRFFDVFWGVARPRGCRSGTRPLVFGAYQRLGLRGAFCPPKVSQKATFGSPFWTPWGVPFGPPKTSKIAET